MFPVHGKMDPRWPQMGSGGFFPTNPDLADILGDTDFDFENFHFWDFLDPKFPGSQIFKFHEIWLRLGLVRAGVGLGRVCPLAGPGGPSAGPGAPRLGRILLFLLIQHRSLSWARDPPPTTVQTHCPGSQPLPSPSQDQDCPVGG